MVSRPIRDFATTYAVRVLGVGLNMVSSILTARFLGPEGRGLLATSQTAVQVGTQFGTLGLQATFCRDVARDPSRSADAATGSLMAGLVVGGAIAILIWSVDAHGSGWFPMPRWLLLVTLMCIPLGLVNTLLSGVLQGRSMFSTINGLDLGQRLVGVGFLAILALLGAMTAGKVIAFGFLLGVSFVAFVVMFCLKGRIGTMAGGWKLVRDSTSFSFRSWTASVSSYLLLRSPMILVQHQFPKEHVGQFAIAMSIIDIVLILPQSAATILFPRLLGTTSGVERRRDTDRVMVLSMVAAAACGAALYLFGEWIIDGFFGEAFKPSYRILLGLIPGLVSATGLMILNQRLAAEGMHWSTTLAPLAGSGSFWLWHFASSPDRVAGAATIGLAGSFSCWIAFALLLLRDRIGTKND